MNKRILIYLMLIFTCLGAVHNFTVNGQESITVAAGDSINIYFEFEEEGATATVNIEPAAGGFDLPEIPIPELTVTDGIFPDAIGADGIFEYSLRNFVSLPEIVSLVITLEDNGVSDEVEIGFEQLESDFSVSGRVDRESAIDMPVFPALIYTFYNSVPEDIISVLDEPNIDGLLEYFSSDHFIVSDVNGFWGDYQLFVPDDIENVPCVTGVLSSYTGSEEYVQPGLSFNEINGHEEDVNFYYAFPDAIFSGQIVNGNGETVSQAAVTLSKSDDLTETIFDIADSLGNFSFAVMNGDYWLNVAAPGYSIYQQELTVDGEDINLEIQLEDLVGIEDNAVVADNGYLKIYPNPFNLSINSRSSEVSILFDLPVAGNSNLEVFNVKGQKVHEKTVKALKNEKNIVKWDVLNESYNAVSNGVYFIKLRSGKVTKTGKMLILK